MKAVVGGLPLAVASKGMCMMPRLRRALLFMPGDDPRKIARGAASGVDGVIMDLEDGVADTRKQAARSAVADALRTLDFGRTERLVRLNSPAGGLLEGDLAATVAARPDGYVLPKVERADDVRRVSALLAEAEAAHGWPAGGIRLLALIETARGVMELREIARADPRLDALIFGAEDLAGDIGATRSRQGHEVAYARSAVVIAAAAYGLQPIDTVYPDLHDADGLAEETRRAAALGFAGKLAIHPRQVDIIVEALRPSTEQVEQARRLVDAYAEHQRAGRGAFALDGRMVDAPMLRAAERVLARAGEGM
jgi:citrate lyase beta subunit